ncbi:hypothetical protein FNV43_RR12324 [Rhamnella rubrinervis]|uniref:Uncharacterized protein n=1 Tax=Rhamnella rubrinervis TaxID=2594499 RepID=A0A8K0H7N3_9ROSA|nr:hypothetical protein FNV43_RR12324 [Rhamnella rubrinervis]
MGGKDHEINIEEDPYASLVSSITKNELEKVRPISSTTCIYKVPDRLRRANEAAYTPNVVSIGPIHHDKSLQIIKDHKRRFLKNFLERTDNDLIHYAKIVKDSEQRLRGCYQETFELSSNEFCHIILVDAVFLVELFFCYYPEQTEVRVQPPDGSRWSSYARQVLDDIGPELLLLENQLPFFILEEIWKDATSKSIVRFFQRYYSLSLNLEERKGANLDEMPMHFVDLVRKLYIPHKPKSGPKRGNSSSS